MDNIESEVLESIQLIPDLCRENDSEWVRGYWTQLIKENLRILAHNNGYRALANGCPHCDNNYEWLYDMIWLEQEDEYISNVPLVLESELNSPHEIVDDDFQKLLLAKAEHRIWIFERTSTDEIYESFDHCIQHIENFALSNPGDRYLMFGVDWDPRNFLHCHYIYP